MTCTYCGAAQYIHGARRCRSCGWPLKSRIRILKKHAKLIEERRRIKFASIGATP